MTEPARPLQTFPSVTLDVRFQEGMLWKARYPSLIRDDLVPWLQFEPAFQVCSEDPNQQVEVLFRIAAEEQAVFAPIGREVSWQSLVPDNPAPNVQVVLVNERECRVLWTRSGAPLTALRIACHRLVSVPDQPPASDPNAAALMEVEGGVYLAIIDPGEVLHRFPTPLRNSAPPTGPGRVRVVEIDNRSRPVYDLFTATNLPEELAPELAFRAAHGESLALPIALDLPDHNIHFKVENGQVAMEYVFPTERPGDLVGTPASEENRLCTLQWSVPPFAVPSGGRVASLDALLDPERLNGPLKTAITQVRIDPTVIEPPPCDANGVCTKPRDQESE